MYRAIIIVVIAVSGLASAATASAANLVSRYVAGQDYKVIDHPLPPARDGRIRVREFFLYSCPHCFHFEPRLEKWQKHEPAGVDFTHSPVLFGRGSERYARLFYAEAELALVPKLHDAIFHAIHRNHNPLLTAGAQSAFMKSHGVAPSRFEKALDSDKVKQDVANARERMQRFGVRAVPSMSVAGRYWVNGRMAGSNARMLKVVDYLVEQTREKRGDTNNHGS